MLKTLTVTHVMPVGGRGFFIHGLNNRLVLGLGVGGYILSSTPVRDARKVEVFSSWLLDSAERLYRGAHIQLGMLTGELNSALVTLKGGIQGAGGDPHVVVRGFQSEWGLATVIYEIPDVSPAVYYLKTVVMYEPA